MVLGLDATNERPSSSDGEIAQKGEYRTKNLGKVLLLAS